jgi:hypothetical protein
MANLNMKNFIKFLLFIISFSFIILLFDDINIRIAMFFNLFLFLVLSFLKFWISKKDSFKYEEKLFSSDVNNKNIPISNNILKIKSSFSKAKILLKKYSQMESPQFKYLIGNPESKELMKIKNSFI